MKKRTLLIWFGGNLLIALFGILQAFLAFNRVFGVMLYFGKHDNRFPDGIESWIYPALQDGRDRLICLFGALLVLLVFNCISGLWIWLSKRKDDHVA
jgi:hypothetical protein